MQQLARHRALVVGLMCLALAVRLASALWWQSRLPPESQFGFPDSQSYWTLAQSVARGQPYQFGESRVFRTPGYPLLLAGLFRLVGDDDPPVLWARALGAVLGALAVGGIAWLTLCLFDERAALIAGLLAAVYPGAVAMSTFILSESLFCPLLVAHLLLWTAAWRCERAERSWWLALFAGVVAGVATLVRPSWLLFTPFALAVAVVTGRRRPRHLAMGMVMLAGLALAMVPWWMRNYRVAGRFVPTTLQVGASLYDGLNPNATGASEMSFVSRFETQQRREDASGQIPFNSTYEQRLDNRMRGEAVAWAKSHPGRAVQLAGVKLVRMWNIWPNEPSLRSWPLRLLVMLGYVPLLVAGGWGAWKYSARGWPYLLCVLPAVYFTLLHLIFVSSIRYRQPAMLTIIVLAAGVAANVVLRKQDD